MTLQCRAPGEASISLLEWNRPDLKSDGYIFFYRNKRSYEPYQHPSYRGRVELRDPEMKDGDASVVLKSVTVNDTGRYECRIIIIHPRSNDTTHSEIKCLTNLMVTDTGAAGISNWNLWNGLNMDGYLEIVVVVSVIGGLLLVGVISCVIYGKLCTKPDQPSSCWWRSVCLINVLVLCCCYRNMKITHELKSFDVL